MDAMYNRKLQNVLLEDLKSHDFSIIFIVGY